ncbi:LysR family transcriptional regulator, chromosome initiation inhibitor [Raineyella antarctica]|uniref:LysR family transcriptional regulator, chromosome initiation inhibitor n=1 Tax=Raineyella antarctica TaxID=1577474 RepID=A0A1G6H7H9_9ACTN|nr:LysR family transcriptional regulator ArgP [Raineyella antarctica]SDB90104.1 LysR family transcriptional regulator, chromosome initiation inhibitor [Raineyella antarctica]
MNFEQLRALLAVVDEGTFEAAADELGVSPSAVSQRIKALETSVGNVVVRRAVPCVPTQAGSVLLRMARQVALLEAETMEALGTGGPGQAILPLAVNADSLATWFLPVLDDAAAWGDTVVRLRVEDEAHTSDLLRSGDVVGAVTAAPQRVAGCSTEKLGAIRYQPVAAPRLCELHSSAVAGKRVVDWARMPVLRYGPKDDLQNRFLREHGIEVLPPSHHIPSSEAYLAAARAGLGWGLVPEVQMEGMVADGSLEILGPRDHRDVPLYWQVWKLGSPRIERLTASVRGAAEAIIALG